MPEIATFGKRFCFYFYKTWEKTESNGRSTDEVNKAAETRRLSSQQVNLSRAARVCARLCLVVGRITLSELGLRSGLPALHVASAVALWDEFAFAVRIRRDDHSAAGG